MLVAEAEASLLIEWTEASLRLGESDFRESDQLMAGFTSAEDPSSPADLLNEARSIPPSLDGVGLISEARLLVLRAGPLVRLASPPEAGVFRPIPGLLALLPIEG